jgi:hypothetical protein
MGAIFLKTTILALQVNEHGEINCNCERCRQGEQYWIRREEESIAKYGWYAHIDMHACGSPNHVNIHTHGIKKAFGHLEFQCCFPIDPNVVLHIWHNLVGEIKQGKKFLPYTDYFGYLSNEKYPLRFVPAMENGRFVLRMLVCDGHGKYDRGPYKEQFRGTL